MARKKAEPKKATREDREAWARLFSEAFFEVMTALTRAEPVEAAYAKFAPEAQRRTKAEHKRLAELAGRYIAERAGPDPSRLSIEESESLTVEALEFALGQPDNEEQA
jgi:hypothetical protein